MIVKQLAPSVDINNTRGFTRIKDFENLVEFVRQNKSQTPRLYIPATSPKLSHNLHAKHGLKLVTKFALGPKASPNLRAYEVKPV